MRIIGAAVKQSIKNGLKSYMDGMVGCMCICMWVYLFFFTDFSGLTAHRKAKVVPYGTVVDNTLLKHVFRAVRFPARAWHHVLRSHGLDIMARAVDATVASPVYSIATVA